MPEKNTNSKDLLYVKDFDDERDGHVIFTNEMHDIMKRRTGKMPDKDSKFKPTTKHNLFG
jgi:hypothetical protein